MTPLYKVGDRVKYFGRDAFVTAVYIDIDVISYDLALSLDANGPTVRVVDHMVLPPRMPPPPINDVDALNEWFATDWSKP